MNNRHRMIARMKQEEAKAEWKKQIENAVKTMYSVEELAKTASLTIGNIFDVIGKLINEEFHQQKVRDFYNAE